MHFGCTWRDSWLHGEGGLDDGQWLVGRGWRDLRHGALSCVKGLGDFWSMEDAAAPSRLQPP